MITDLWPWCTSSSGMFLKHTTMPWDLNNTMCLKHAEHLSENRIIKHENTPSPLTSCAFTSQQHIYRLFCIMYLWTTAAHRSATWRAPEFETIFALELAAVSTCGQCAQHRYSSSCLTNMTTALVYACSGYLLSCGHRVFGSIGQTYESRQR